jgi:hypothetical protein
MADKLSMKSPPSHFIQFEDCSRNLTAEWSVLSPDAMSATHSASPLAWSSRTEASAEPSTCSMRGWTSARSAAASPPAATPPSAASTSGRNLAGDAVATATTATQGPPRTKTLPRLPTTLCGIVKFLRIACEKKNRQQKKKKKKKKYCGTHPLPSLGVSRIQGPDSADSDCGVRVEKVAVTLVKQCDRGECVGICTPRRPECAGDRCSGCIVQRKPSRCCYIGHPALRLVRRTAYQDLK